MTNLKVGSPEDPDNYMGPVISAGAKKSILAHIAQGKSEGRLSRVEGRRRKTVTLSSRP